MAVPFVRRLYDRGRTLWLLAKSERSSPREIGVAVGLGVFAGCTPAVGVHGWVAVGLATLFRKNRLWAWLGSRVSNFVLLPFIVWLEIDLAHRLRTGEGVVFDRAHVLEQAGALMLDWCVGALLVGTVLGVLLGFAAAAWMRARQRRLADAARPP